MKTLIVYATKYGATRVCAQRLAQALRDGADLAELGRDPVPDLAAYDCVLLGSSVYMGVLRKELRRWAALREPLLLHKKVGLFLCCIQDLEETLKAQFDAGFSQALRQHACAARALGGTVVFARLRPWDRFIMGLVAGRSRKASGDVDTLSQERIRDFARAVEQA